MASFAYKSLNLIYDRDEGGSIICHQKLEVIPGTSDTYAPIVSSIQARRYTTSSKFEGTSINLRHVNIATDLVETRVVIPYSQNSSSTLKSCIRQVLDSSGVVAGRYRGESYLNGNTANDDI